VGRVRASARARSACGSRRWKASRVGKARSPFTRQRAETALASSEASARSETDRRARRRRRQRRQGRVRFEPREGPILLARLGRLAQRSARRETRVPPISLPSPGPEPCGELRFALGRDGVARLNAARREHEAQASLKERPPLQIGPVSSSGAHEAQGCSRKRNWFGVQTSVGTHRPAATPGKRELRPRKRAT